MHSPSILLMLKLEGNEKASNDSSNFVQRASTTKDTGCCGSASARIRANCGNGRRMGGEEAVVLARRLLLPALLVLSAFALALMLLSDGGSGTRTNLLASMLCCEGCCMSTSSVSATLSAQSPSAGGAQDETFLQPGRSTVLHLAGQSEIDYTANGHRVSQHMESALNELNDIEDHVKSGIPKFLKESAAQREADLMNHKFTQDLQGDKNSRSEPAVDAMKSTANFGRKDLEEAAKMDAYLKKDATNDKKLFKSSNTDILRGVKAAENEAKKALHFKSFDVKQKPREESIQDSKATLAKEELNSSRQKAKKGVAEKPSRSSPEGDNGGTISHFVPITSVGLQKEEQSDAKQGASHHSKKSKIDQEIVYRLAAKDLQYRDEQRRKESQRADSAANSKIVSKPAMEAQTTNQDEAQKKTEHSPERNPKTSQVAANSHSNRQKKVIHSPHTENRLNGVLSRIDNLIGGYTGGASRHSKFFRHFDSEKARQAAELKGIKSRQQSLHTNDQAELRQSSEGADGKSTSASAISTNSDQSSVRHSYPISDALKIVRKQASLRMDKASEKLYEVMGRHRKALSPAGMHSVLNLKLSD
eukprot:768473-Hanusia_phi.AAC.26